MKTTKLILFLVLLLSPLLVNAYAGEYPWDPLYFEEVKDPLDSIIDNMKQGQSTNQQTINRLKSWYGITDYYTCYNSQSACKGDTSNPSIMSFCLIGVEGCLERKQIQEERERECNLKNGYYWSNGFCLSKDQGCKSNYGQYSYYTGRDFICDCLTGYEWQNDTCVLKQTPNVGRIILEPAEPKVLGDSTNALNLQAGWLIKNKEFAEVFYVDNDLSLRWIINEQSAFKHFGDFWWQKIHEYDEIPAGYVFGYNLE